MPDLADDSGEWEVEEVQGKRRLRGDIQYLVKWAGWPAEYNQWIDADDMANAQGAIRAFEGKRGAYETKAKSARSRKRARPGASR